MHHGSKLRLRVDALRVESFETDREAAFRGTVMGNGQDRPPFDTVGDIATCNATCRASCDTCGEPCKCKDTTAA